MDDKYASFADLATHEADGRDYRVRAIERPDAAAVIIAPHGGHIEAGTSELADLIAGTEHSLFAFEGLKPWGQNRALHITSHRFDHPGCLALIARHAIAIGVHGCQGEARIYVGGLDTQLSALLTQRLRAAGFLATAEGHKYAGINPQNICNRGARKRGAQLEITMDLRAPPAREHIGCAVRAALEDYCP